MASPTHIQNIALVGATGNLGTHILHHLLHSTTQTPTITVLTRSPSHRLPSHPSLTIKVGDYTSPDFLASAFADQEAVIFALHYTAVPKLETQIIEAAAKAGVKWIIPVEYGGDSANEELVKKMPMYGAKVAPRKRVEELGMKWIGVVTGCWFDYGIKSGIFLINVKDKTANILTGKSAKSNTTTLDTAGLAVARIFDLSVKGGADSSLNGLSNRFVYVSSFNITQREMLDAIQRATDTTNAEWEITYTDVQTCIDEGAALVAKGDMRGGFKLLIGNLSLEGAGGDYESVRGLSNDILRLPREDLDEVTKKVVQEILT